MDVKAISINQVFLSNRVLKIPFFQRGYVWEQSNWQHFFDDILNIASTPENEREVYFLGSIIFKNSENNGKQQLDVIDGQQRLTTIVLFMKALCLALGRDDLFIKDFMQVSLTGDPKPILITNYNDIPVYQEIIKLETLKLEPIQENRLAEAFSYFAKRIKEAQNPQDDEMSVSPDKLYEAVMDYVRLVSIEVQERENAQKIFETINCTGIKLTTGEMLKNYLFDESKVEDYERTWKTVFESTNTSYWENDIVNGRTQGNHIENFFYRYMLIKMQEPSIKAGLSGNEQKYYRQMGGQYEKFRSLIQKFDISKDSIIDEIVDYAKLYLNTFKSGMLEEAIVSYPGIERLAYLMFMQDTWTMTPFILYILKNVSSETERTKIFKYLEIYLFRRIICKSKNNNYSDLFSENLIGQRVCSFEEFKSYLNDSEKRGNLLMPSDSEVVTAILNNDLKRDAQTILYMVESKINSNFTTSDKNNSYLNFKKEQLMPEEETIEWPLTNEEEKTKREQLAKTIGNFTLLRDKLNSKQRKATWSEKKSAIKPVVGELETSLFLTRELPEWNLTNLEKRNKFLADAIIENWPI